MARRRKKSDEDGCAALIAFVIGGIVVLFILVSLAAPLALLVGWLWNLNKLRSLKSRLTGTYSDFWLDANEKALLIESYNKWATADQTIGQANQHGEAAGLARNQDGGFSRRSDLGKRLRDLIESNEPLRQQHAANFESLSELPQARWAAFSGVHQYAKGFQWGLIAWIFCFCALSQLLFGGMTNGIGHFTSLAGKLLDQAGREQLTQNDWMLALPGAVISFFVVLAGKAIAAKQTATITPIPPLVDLNNVNDY